MEAFILSFCMVAFAGVLTRRHTKQVAESEKKSQKTETLQTDGSTSERPYYERFISKNNSSNFIDYSGGMLGI